MNQRRLIPLFCTVLCAPASALAGSISLTGGLGTGSWGLPATLPVNSGFTQPFSKSVPGFGTISGDVIINNINGTQFDLRVTNTTFQITGGNPGNLTQIRLVVFQSFVPQTPNASYNASHDLNGSWTPTGFNAITADSLQGILGPNPQALPSLGYFNNPSLPTGGFGPGPVGANVSNSSPTLYGMQCTIDFFLDGNGFIDLPNSYDATAIEIPAPGSLAFFGLAGAITTRRRR